MKTTKDHPCFWIPSTQTTKLNSNSSPTSRHSVWKGVEGLLTWRFTIPCKAAPTSLIQVPRKGNQNCSYGILRPALTCHCCLEQPIMRRYPFSRKRNPSKLSCQHWKFLQILLHTVDQDLQWHATFIRPTLRRDIQHQQQQIENACFWIRHSRNSWSHSALVDLPWFPKSNHPTVVKIRWSHKVQKYGTSSEIYPRKTHEGTCPEWSPSKPRLQADTNTLRGHSSHKERIIHVSKSAYHTNKIPVNIKDHLSLQSYLNLIPLIPMMSHQLTKLIQMKT